MKINKIEIGNFGKFQNYKLDFDDGINIIYGNNEDGKSTIMAFIKMMFYGSTGKSVDLSKNIRKKYMPWNGAKMSGAIEFEDKGINYRIEKIFGASNATDKVNLWNKAAGEKEKVASGTDIGQRFFGIGAAAFEKSVFIGQIGSTIGSEVDKEDEITQKLLNLVSTGDESVSQKKVTDRLRTAKEALKSKSGRVGALDKLNKRLDELSDNRKEALEDEKRKKQLEEQYTELVKEEERLKADYELNKAQYNMQEKLVELGKIENLISKKKYIDDLIAELSLKKQHLTVGDITFDNEFVKNSEEQISKVQTLQKLKDEKSENLKLFESESSKLKSEPACEISKEYVENAKAKQRKEADLQRNIEAIKNSIREAEQFLIRKNKGQAVLVESKKKLDSFVIQQQEEEGRLAELKRKVDEAEEAALKAKKAYESQVAMLSSAKDEKEKANTEYQIAFNNTKYVEKLSSQKIDISREKFNQISTARKAAAGKNTSNTINKTLLAAAAVILVISIILGTSVNLICFAGAVIAALLCIVAFGSNKTSKTSAAVEEEVRKAEENLRFAESEAEKEEQAAFEAEEKAREVLKELEIRVELLENEASKLQKQHNDSSLRLSRVKQGFNELQFKLKFIGEKVSAAEEEVACEKNELDELIGSSMEISDADIARIKTEFQEKTAMADALKDEVEKLLADKNCKTTDELQNKYSEWQSYETKLAAKTEELHKAVFAENEAKDNLEAAMKKLLEEVSQYRTVKDIDETVKAAAKLKNAIYEVNTIEIKINSQTEFLSSEIQGKTVSQLKQQADELRQEVLKLNNGILPEKCDGQHIEELKQSNEHTWEKLQKTKEQLIQLRLTIKNQFAGKKNVSEVENEIHELKEEISEKNNYYDCLSIAESTINEAFNEISQSFGPLLNSKTTEIFNSLTDGKYENVIISRNFDINVQNAESIASHEWKYLSSGTIDQAYFALRLSISDLFSGEGTRLPLLLDDIFLQYDEGRAKQGLRFLADYSQRYGMDAQVILFTCQRSIVELARKNFNEFVIRSIVQ